MNNNNTFNSRVVIVIAFAMLAFAANSVLCRIALEQASIDPGVFTAIRLISGAVTLWIIVIVTLPRRRLAGSWQGATLLFLYSICFSYAYVSLDTGTGALILFGAVQVTMLGYGFFTGESMTLVQVGGVALAVAGLVILLLPGATSPSLLGATLMAISGAAWGGYSILGKYSNDPIASTAGNFILSAPIVILMLPLVGSFQMDTVGFLYGVASGAAASGVGYVAWYYAARNISSFSAATVQLSVPVLAALGGITFLSEPMSTRLILSSLAVIGGVLLVLCSKKLASSNRGG